MTKKNSFGDYFRGLTIHGPTDIISSPTVIQQFFWISLFVFAAAFLSYGIYGNVNDFMESPILTSYLVKSEPIEFPNIYICPMNPVNGVATALNNLSNFWGRSYLEDAQSIVDDANPYYTDGCRVGDKALSYFSKAGYVTNQLFRQCSFAQRPMECSKIVERVFDPVYGLCYLVKVVQKQTLPSARLQLALDLQSNLAPFSSFLNGILLAIEKDHDPADPSSKESRIHAPAGGLTKISMSATRMSLINYKSKKFVQECQESKVNLQFLNTKYTETACRMECAQKIIQRECGCNCLVMDEKYQETTPGKVCQSIDEVNKCLAKKESLKKELDQCNSDCLPRCESWTFNPSISFVKFNTENYNLRNGIEDNENVESSPTTESPSLLQGSPSLIDYQVNIPSTNFRKKREAEANGSKYDPKRPQDYIILDIAFDQIRYSELSQELSMTFERFLSHLGGQMGLWLGASILSLIQVITIVVLCCTTKPKKMSPLYDDDRRFSSAPSAVVPDPVIGTFGKN